MIDIEFSVFELVHVNISDLKPAISDSFILQFGSAEIKTSYLAFKLIRGSRTLTLVFLADGDLETWIASVRNYVIQSNIWDSFKSN